MYPIFVSCDVICSADEKWCGLPSLAHPTNVKMAKAIRLIDCLNSPVPYPRNGLWQFKILKNLPSKLFFFSFLKSTNETGKNCCNLIKCTKGWRDKSTIKRCEYSSSSHKYGHEALCKPSFIVVRHYKSLGWNYTTKCNASRKKELSLFTLFAGHIFQT